MTQDNTNKQSLFKTFLQAIKGGHEDFTSGSIRKAIFLLAVPMILEMLMESIFALVDIIYVSQVSENAVATVGLTESVITLLYAVAIGLSMAATALVARRVGEKQIDKARSAAVQALILGVLVAIVVGFIGIFYAKDILRFMGGSPELIEEGHGYTQWLLGGNITIMLLFLINAVFRGAGDASLAMWALVLSNGLNLILDPIFIFGWGPIPEYGVMGAGIATNIGRGTAVIFQLFILFSGKSRIQLFLHNIKVQADQMWNLMKVSAGGISQFLIGTSSWVILMYMMAKFGTDVLAGYTIAIRVMMFTLMPSWGMSNAAATLVGQNLGAGKPDRAEKSVWTTGRYNAYFMGAVSVFYLLFAKTIIGLLVENPVVIENGALCLQVIAAGYLFYAYGMVLTQAFNGSGDTQTPTRINLVSFWCYQLQVAYLLAFVLDLGPLGVFIAITTSEVLLAIISWVLFKKGKWKTFQV